MADYRTERALGAPGVTEFPNHHDRPQKRAYSTYEHAAAEAAVGPHGIHDVASVLGLPPEAVTPALLAAITPLLNELDALRWQAEQERRRRALVERAADRHSLLPCYNRRAFLRELDALLTSGDAEGALGLIHLGGIEALRLSHGLPAADAALIHACATILGNLRASDMVGSLGGGDFAVLLLGASEAGADKMAELARRINDPPFLWMGNDIRLVATVGAIPLAPGQSADQTLAAADRALLGRD